MIDDKQPFSQDFLQGTPLLAKDDECHTQNSFTIEINMLLNVRGRYHSKENIEWREAQAMSLLQSRGQCEVSRCDVKIGGVLVPRLVAKLAGENWTRTDFVHLADQLEQDCIAIYYPSTGQGELIGPFAASWGDFDFNLFQKFENAP